MKSITGSTSLIFPFALWQMGLITGTLLNMFIVYVYCSCAYRLLQVRKVFETEEKDESDPLYHLDNDYTIMCYHYFGKFGYWLILLSTLITLWGSDMGTMILMTDFLTALPFFKNMSSSKYLQRLLPTIILFVCSWLTCILKNPSLLAGVSSLGLFALIAAFVVLLVYGGTHWGISWDTEVLYPQSLMGILSNIGIIINAYGFLLVLFPLYNNLKTKEKPRAGHSITFSVVSLSAVYLITGAILFLMFRQDPRHVQQAILMNLPGDSFAYYAVAATMVLTLLGSFPLLLLPCFEILETNVRKYEMKE
ncbi:hypothetical protein JH06_5485 [Blastocystis sp. subtype 4]|uniref:hypothetical protein n=1 Tax=Blastocystis sp. subtype 4 TaxID=944170 RepID=UPI000711F185|nr:hypothetical protein JH06_5485 [Blastocystis sp. subtype 4]KNB45561.1 hypothetical protein JH06_5485 [Blastocystis sp. subtype 4]|eukprot:XP_014529017.1 hypothetical protein JH06_5485 [Blastocystis sp. subtype 4]